MRHKLYRQVRAKLERTLFCQATFTASVMELGRVVSRATRHRATPKPTSCTVEVASAVSHRTARPVHHSS